MPEARIGSIHLTCGMAKHNSSEQPRFTILDRAFVSLATLCVIILFGVRFLAEDELPVADEDAVYVIKEANLRLCPSTTCDVFATVGQHRQLLIVRSVAGRAKDSDGPWFEVEFGIDTVFVDSSVVTRPTTDLSPWFETILPVALLAIAATIGLIGKSSRVAAIAGDMDKSRVDSGLYGVVVLGGVATGSIGLALAVADGQSLLAFWSSAFVSFGAGLVGSGIVFVVFQRVVRYRPPPTEDIRADIADLRSEVGALMRRAESESTPQSPQRSQGLVQRFWKSRYRQPE